MKKLAKSQALLEVEILKKIWEKNGIRGSTYAEQKQKLGVKPVNVASLEVKGLLDEDDKFMEDWDNFVDTD